MSERAQYRRVAEAISTDLRAQEREPGFKLPNVRELAKTYTVSSFTISKALELLEAGGMIERRWAVGCFLKKPAPRRAGKDKPPTIGILLDPRRLPSQGWNFALLEGTIAAIQAQGATPVFVSWREDLALDADVDGLLAWSEVLDEGQAPERGKQLAHWLRALAARRFPVVTMDFDVPGVSSVQIDNAGGAAQAARYLVHLGHRRIAYAGVARNGNSEERLAGLRGVLAAEGIPHGDDLVWLTRPSPKTSHQLFPAFRAGRSFTAICCFEDYAATGIVRAARELGLRVPGGLSVIGYGNLPVGEFAVMPLTTVDVNPRELTGQAVRLLGEMLGSDEARVVKLKVPGQLLVRESSGPPLAPVPAAEPAASAKS